MVQEDGEDQGPQGEQDKEDTNSLPMDTPH